ncbi:protein Hook homolog 2-like [Notothenia coriiceps]|uniref:Protein Hook homolog 2-like n=1 Tax=Notothenia coriiceps TaxID=8208 RepID=A0A6I9N2W2_9TELE|nr:PREDICTED: protein Hook homolog 2-like [Notothenia coriiceps]
MLPSPRTDRRSFSFVTCERCHPPGFDRTLGHTSRVQRYQTPRVIKTLDPKQQPDPGAPEIQALKNQLTEKEKKLQHLEHDYEKSRVRHDQEEKLIITAWYNMVSLRVQKKHEDDRTGFYAFQKQYRF